MSWVIFTMGAAFLFNTHLGEKQNKKQTELEDEAQDDIR